VAADKDEAARVLSQVKRTIRANYSNPPTHGGQIVATVLCSPELRALWETELAAMRDRIKKMRGLLVEMLQQQVPRADFRFILEQRGMFSYSGLTKAQVHALRDEFSIYAIDTGRICVAALNHAQRRGWQRRSRSRADRGQGSRSASPRRQCALPHL
jgi:aromatic-amino-acid transaminase